MKEKMIWKRELSCLRSTLLKFKCTLLRRTTRSWKPSTNSHCTSNLLYHILWSWVSYVNVVAKCICERASSRKLTQTSSRLSKTTMNQEVQGELHASNTWFWQICKPMKSFLQLSNLIFNYDNQLLVYKHVLYLLKNIINRFVIWLLG